MGSSAMKYGNRSDDFKSLFREYVDNGLFGSFTSSYTPFMSMLTYEMTDAGRLTHQKFYALVSAQNPSAVPKWMVIGSTNFWSGAMGCIGRLFHCTQRVSLKLSSYNHLRFQIFSLEEKITGSLSS